MSFTYSGNPSSSALETVRFLLGDTDSAEPKLSDEEIGFLLVEWSDVYQAAAAGADHLSATAASWMSYSTDGNSLNLSELQAKYSQLADALRGQGRRRFRVAPYAGGIDVGDRYAAENDDSVVPMIFTVHEFDNPETGAAYGVYDKRDLTGGIDR